MTQNGASTSVVVGIDGSPAGISAALWAVDEAVSRGLPLRLVHASAGRQANTSAAQWFQQSTTTDGEEALRAASHAIHATGSPVAVETTAIAGAVGTTLLDESARAALICVGSDGIGRLDRLVLGSTVTALAEGAHCPVAIIRPREEQTTPGPRWIAAVVDLSPEHDAVMRHALDEARRRTAGVLAVGVWREDLGEHPDDELDRRIEKWTTQYPDVHIRPVTTRAGVARFLAEDDQADNDVPVGLVVIGPTSARQVARIVGPHHHTLFGHPAHSVMIVRG